MSFTLGIEQFILQVRRRSFNYMGKPILTSTGKLRPDTLASQIAIVTGAGGGIGFEASRALIWLGARVIIAEIDKQAGSNAAAILAREMGNGKVTFIHTDVETMAVSKGWPLKF
jgi:pyruvate/2-oxoglutarate dehydrogenase complex dihydrolipoamide dehydrogenase (E3) component